MDKNRTVEKFHGRKNFTVCGKRDWSLGTITGMQAGYLEMQQEYQSPLKIKSGKGSKRKKNGC